MLYSENNGIKGILYFVGDEVRLFLNNEEIILKKSEINLWNINVSLDIWFNMCYDIYRNEEECLVSQNT